MAARRAGVVSFAGVLFAVLGAFTIIDGLVALIRPEQLFVGENSLIIKDYTTWGIALLILGGVQLAVGVEILTGARRAQVAAVVLAGLSFIVQLTYFKAFPAWSVVSMLVDTVVIYGLVVHSDEFARALR